MLVPPRSSFQTFKINIQLPRTDKFCLFSHQTPHKLAWLFARKIRKANKKTRRVDDDELFLYSRVVLNTTIFHLSCCVCFSLVTQLLVVTALVVGWDSLEVGGPKTA